MSTPAAPILIEHYQNGIEAWTQRQAARIVYQVRQRGAVVWQTIVALNRRTSGAARFAALEQDQCATRLAREGDKA